MMKLGYSLTNNTLTIVLEGKIYSLKRTGDQADVEKAQDALTFIKTGNQEGLEQLLKPVKKVENYIKETQFSVNSFGQVLVDNIPIAKAIGVKLLAFAQEGLPIEPLINFWNNLKENPSKESIEDLYSFLDKNHHPITFDGCFYAYKKVQNKNGKLVDSHTGTFDNNVGTIVEMSRDQVNPDRNATCSNGLHVASWEYAQGFSGDTLILVKVDPRHVVAVPIDYNRQKMRCCQYEVVSVVTGEKEIKEHLIQPTNESAVKNTGRKITIDYQNTVSQILQLVENTNVLNSTQIKVLKGMNRKNKKAIVNKALYFLSTYKDVIAKIINQ